MSTTWTPARRAAALATCREWHGTPFGNRVAIPGKAIDCIHFVARVLEGAGLIERPELPAYDTRTGRHSSNRFLREALLASLHAEEAEKSSPEFGDIVTFKTGRFSQHCAFYTDGEIWHSLANSFVNKHRWQHWKREAECLIRITGEGLRANPAEFTNAWHATLH